MRCCAACFGCCVFRLTVRALTCLCFCFISDRSLGFPTDSLGCLGRPLMWWLFSGCSAFSDPVSFFLASRRSLLFVISIASIDVCHGFDVSRLLCCVLVACAASSLVSFGLFWVGIVLLRSAQLFCWCCRWMAGALKVLLQSRHLFYKASFWGTFWHSVFEWFVFPIAVPNAFLQYAHVYFRFCSCFSVSFRRSAVFPWSVFQHYFCLFSLSPRLSSIPSGISGCLATSFVTAFFSFPLT